MITDTNCLAFQCLLSDQDCGPLPRKVVDFPATLFVTSLTPPYQPLVPTARPVRLTTCPCYGRLLVLTLENAIVWPVDLVLYHQTCYPRVIGCLQMCGHKSTPPLPIQCREHATDKFISKIVTRFDHHIDIEVAGSALFAVDVFLLKMWVVSAYDSRQHEVLQSQ